MTESKVYQYNGPELATRHPFAKPCMMTIFMHDYAHPASAKIDFLLLKMKGKPKEPMPLEIFTNWTMALVRTLTDEQLGKLIRKTLLALDDTKNKIENR